MAAGVVSCVVPGDGREDEDPDGTEDDHAEEQGVPQEAPVRGQTHPGPGRPRARATPANQEGDQGDGDETEQLEQGEPDVRSVPEREIQHLRDEGRGSVEPEGEGPRQEGRHEGELAGRKAAAPETGTPHLEEEDPAEGAHHEEVGRQVMREDESPADQREGNVPANVAPALDQHPKRSHAQEVAKGERGGVGDREEAGHRHGGDRGGEEGDGIVRVEPTEKEEQREHRQDGDHGYQDRERAERVDPEGTGATPRDKVDAGEVGIGRPPTGVRGTVRERPGRNEVDRETIGTPRCPTRTPRTKSTARGPGTRGEGPVPRGAAASRGGAGLARPLYLPGPGGTPSGAV